MSEHPITKALSEMIDEGLPEFSEEEKTRLSDWVLRQMSKESSAPAAEAP